MIAGAGIFCVVCGARPYPELGPPETREDFDLMRLDRDGHLAGSPAPGEWFCSLHLERASGSDGITAEWIPANEERAIIEAAS
jgi:hypothetical protein